MCGRVIILLSWSARFESTSSYLGYACWTRISSEVCSETTYVFWKNQQNCWLVYCSALNSHYKHLYNHVGGRNNSELWSLVPEELTLQPRPTLPSYPLLVAGYVYTRKTYKSTSVISFGIARNGKL